MTAMSNQSTGNSTRSSPKKSFLTRDMRKQIKECFDQFDCDGSGEIDDEELFQAMGALGFRTDRDEVKNMIDDIDDDGSGTIGFDEFMQMMADKIGNRDPEADRLK